jgi:dynein light chain LC8-type
MQQQAVELASTAMDKYNVEKDVAMWMKKEADRMWGTTWHCVVGKK